MDALPPNTCYHCGLPLNGNTQFSATVLNQPRSMCCPGCQAVAQAIVSNGLEDYYKFRTEFADKGDNQLDDTMATLRAYDQPDIQHEFIVDEGDLQQIQLTIEGISCSACGWLIEKKLLQLDGLHRVAVNVSARRATLSFDQDKLKLSDIFAQLSGIGYHALPFRPDQHEASYQRESKALLRRIGLAGLLSMQVMMLAIGLYFGVFGSIEPQTKSFLHWVSLLLASPVVLFSGLVFYKSAFNAIRLKTVNMDVSVTLAVLGTYFASVWAVLSDSGDVYFESVCMFVFLLLISRYIEHRARYKASQSSANMLKYIPMTATKLISGDHQLTLAKHLTAGDHLLVKPGETFAVDGIILQGVTEVDESMLTGEAKPVVKSQGDVVFGGTINHSNNVTVEVTQELKHSLVNKILRLQETALAAKPKAAIFADHASRYFIVIVLIITVLAYLGWLVYQPQNAFWVAIAILVATCPCALSLATPSALTSAMAKLNRNGILLKRADVLDQIPEIDTLVFDKTGTLTTGKFGITRCHVNSDYTEQDVLRIAAGLQLFSEHPLASAFCHPQPFPVSDIKNVPGFGVQGVWQQQSIRLGKLSFMPNQTAAPSGFDDGDLYLATDEQIIAGFSVQDELKPDAKSSVARLNHKQLIMLTGDAEQNAQPLVAELEFDGFYARCTPEHKLQHLRQLQHSSKQVMMIGDGVNDAPILAQANVSVALGNAADMSKRSADVVLLNNKLASLPLLLDMAERVRRKIKQNLIWAVGYNVLILPLAISGLLTPWMAVIGMSLSSIIVVVNSVRLVR